MDKMDSECHDLDKSIDLRISQEYRGQPSRLHRLADAHSQYLKSLNETRKVVCGTARLLMKLVQVRLLYGNQTPSEVCFSQAAEPCCPALLQAESLQHKSLLSQTCKLNCYWGRLLSHNAMMMSFSRFGMTAGAARHLQSCNKILL